MYIQQGYLKQNETIITGAKVSIELPAGPSAFPILGFLLHWDLETGVGEAAAWVNESVIEVIRDGSEVVVSAQVGELIARAEQAGFRNYPVADLGASATARYILPVFFGRYWRDLVYFLDPRNFASLDLHITQPTHTATTKAQYDVIIERLLQAEISPQGYFKQSTKKAYTAASGVEYVTLDRAYQYGMLLVSEMDGTSTDIATIVSNLKLNLDAGGSTPVDKAGAEVQMENRIVAGSGDAAVLPNVLACTNYLALDWMDPWGGEGALMQAPAYSSVVLEATGTAAGTIRVTGVELVK